MTVCVTMGGLSSRTDELGEVGVDVDKVALAVVRVGRVGHKGVTGRHRGRGLACVVLHSRERSHSARDSEDVALLPRQLASSLSSARSPALLLHAYARTRPH